ncbi:MAG: RlmI/RlmK family 23S rRNA methyltransferase, partial [Thiohalospira sp.]
HLQDNAEVAGLEDRVAPLHGEALEVLKALREDGERFDAVVLDPPAFIKRKRDIKSGLEGYRHLNQLAMQLLSRDGLLLSASCSHHLGMDQLQDVVRGRARHLDRDAAVLARGHQGPDHPIHPAIPETEYLKAVFARILPTQ